MNTLKYISEEAGGRRTWCFGVIGQWLVLVSCFYVLTFLLLLSLSIMMSTLQMRKQRHENITHSGGPGAKLESRHLTLECWPLTHTPRVDPWEPGRVVQPKWQLSHDLKDKLELIRQRDGIPGGGNSTCKGSVAGGHGECRKQKGRWREKRLARARPCKGIDRHAPPRLLPSGFPAHVAWPDAGSGLSESAK